MIAELKASGIDLSRFCLQSFDMRPLQYIHQKYPEIVLALLVEESVDDLSILLDSLGFTPQKYSPYYKILSQQQTEIAQQMGMKVVPWTVNTVEEMKANINWLSNEMKPTPIDCVIKHTYTFDLCIIFK